MDRRQFFEVIEQYNNFVVTCHENPDGDAVGAANALGLLLKQLQKQVTVVFPEYVPRKFRFLPALDYDTAEADKIIRTEVMISLDASTIDRIASTTNMVEYNKMVNIDHHATNSMYGDINIVDSKCSATCELLYDLLSEQVFNIEYEIAVNLFTGILTDTGSFTYENVTSKTFHTVSKLSESGVNSYQVAKEIYESVAVNSFLATREILNNLNLSDDQQIAWLTCSRQLLDKYQISDDEVDGVIDYGKRLEPVEFAVFFKETDEGFTKVSFRSKTLDVDKVAVEYEGGGHARAAGCLVKLSPEDAIDKIIPRLKQELSKSG